ncbi:MAG: hypothetical protein ABIH23_13620 [bacterium]
MPERQFGELKVHPRIQGWRGCVAGGRWIPAFAGMTGDDEEVGGMDARGKSGALIRR